MTGTKTSLIKLVQLIYLDFNRLILGSDLCNDRVMMKNIINLRFYLSTDSDSALCLSSEGHGQNCLPYIPPVNDVAASHPVTPSESEVNLKSSED